MAAGARLKSFYQYPKLFHVSYGAHLLHNCAIKVKSHFEDADQLITEVKSATSKNKAKFTTIRWPPLPIVTSWESWLYAVLYLPEVKAVVESFEECDILVTQAKVSLQKTGLATKLLKIKDQYECPVKPGVQKYDHAVACATKKFMCI